MKTIMPGSQASFSKKSVPTIFGGYCLRSRDFELLADAACGAFLDLAVARHAGNLPVGRIEPDRVRAALAEEDASLSAQVLLQVAELHASTNSIGSRRAFGDRSFSANSR